MPARVLIAEDQRLFRQSLRLLLEREPDLRVVGEATDGREAFDLAMKTKPDMILMDLGMPEMDGWIATEKLKSHEATKSIPLYALTAHTLPIERKRALEAGCDGYLSKPIHMKGFVDVIDEVFSGIGNNKVS